MFTVYIADDDAVIRKGLSCLVPWQELGFEVAGIFEDGQALLKALEIRKVDVILTDIRMHDVSGLDVASYIKEHGIYTNVVILSGYQEFDYARQAVRNNVKDYLLKPISIEKICETFQRLHKELISENELREMQMTLKTRVESLSQSMDEQFFTDAYSGLIRDEGSFQSRIQQNRYTDEDLNRRIVLTNTSCPSNKVSVLIGALNIVRRDYQFYQIKYEDANLLGVLAAKPGADVTFSDNEMDSDSIAEDINALTGESFLIEVIGHYTNARAFAMNRETPILLNSDEPSTQAEAYIRSHFAENITLTDVAARIYVNPVYLSRVFRKKRGMTFSEALARIRLDEALHRLKNTNEPVAAIAYDCGYANVKYFYKQFKRYIGISPGEWRISKQDIGGKE